MSVQLVTVEMRGGPDLVKQTLDGLPGDHQPDHLGGDQYAVATTDAGFLRFALEQQGYGRVISEHPVGPQ